MRFLSIDIGTSAVKAAIVEQSAGIRQAATAPYPHTRLPGGKSEVDPHQLWTALYRACSQLDAALRATVDVVCYDTFSPSPVLMHRDGSLAYPNIITHMDRRSGDQSQYIDEVVGNDRYLSIAGILPFAGGAGAMTFTWLRQNEPYYLEQAFRIGHLPTYVHHRLTGKWVVDLVNASMMGLYETTSQGSWSHELLDAFDIEKRLLSDIAVPGAPLGVLRPDEAARLGVKAGVVVTVGTNDMASAHCGAGNFEAGCIMNVAGSSDMVSILTDEPTTSPNYYLRNTALPGLWQIYATTAGGFAIDWFFEQFCQDMDRATFFGKFLPQALEAYVVDGEVTFDPYLTGDRQSLEKRTGAWHGLTLSVSREEMLAALLKGMNRVLAKTIEEARAVVDLKPVIKLTGGMTDASIIALKEREFPGFMFEVVDNCPLLGNVALANRHLNASAAAIAVPPVPASPSK